MRPKLTEAQLHRQVAAFLDVALPASAVWTTFPAGGGGKVRGAKLKACGLRAGWPDLQVIYAGRFIAIELKAKTGTTSQEQDDCHRQISRAGGEVFLCRSLRDVELSLQCVNVPLRATLNAGHGWSKAA